MAVQVSWQTSCLYGLQTISAALDDDSIAQQQKIYPKNLFKAKKLCHCTSSDKTGDFAAL
jgi:hypothetical protein